MNVKNVYSVVLIAAMAVMAGCSREESSSATENNDLANAAFGEVLAKVNGQTITELDLELAIERTVGSASLVPIDDQARQKILESLVMTKSLAIAKHAELTADEVLSLEREVVAYREEWLAKKYLRENVTATPVTEEMVRQYYAEHPEEFGAEIHKQYELLKARANISESERNAIVETFNQLKNETNWAEAVKKLQQKNIQIDYAQGAMTQGSMASEFERVVKPLQKGEVSPVFFMRKTPTMVRVIAVNQSQPKPLTDVSADIRKQLAPVQLKKAIRDSADSVMQSMTIEYINNH